MHTEANRTRSWGEAWQSFKHPRVISALFLGFSAGLPILLIFSSLSIWLREAGVERSMVTFFSWAALGYSFKFVWAPLVDRLPLPWLTKTLGRRRAWLLLAQFAVMAALLFMASNDPVNGLTWVAIGAVMLGFSSATQDIVIDAWRIEAAESDLQAMMSSAYIAGYRIGMLVAGAGGLALASWFSGGDDSIYDYSAWSSTYQCMAAFMLIGVATTLIISEPETGAPFSSQNYGTSDYVRFVGLFIVAAAAFVAGFTLSPSLTADIKSGLMDIGMAKHVAGFFAETIRLFISIGCGVLAAWLMIRLHVAPRAMVRDTYVAPFTDFFDRYGKLALYILLLVGTYRIADIVMGAVANVFYTDMGYTKDQIAAITKTFGLVMTIAGGFLGGLLAVRYGVMRILWLGGLLAAISNLLFAMLAGMSPESWMLALVIAADNLSAGIASAAFVAFLSSLTNRAFTAMQYAVFSSLMTLVPKLLAGYSGTVVDAVNYPMFFIGSAFLGLPVLLLISYVQRLMEKREES
ncbi:MFS transporter [Endozoicomonas sp. OPT23]|uniref:AmpG family muropeptide MFS transporter n=1 Tax=Endozoicomonas sp. OPT23 TaxID=2072845 RepID=UPI00129A91F9|nr:MFS transporter [Endozoicomonas sp. OPT23]MRI33504.1 MFS transporter [Endozoicomonas sp. OPT23]